MGLLKTIFTILAVIVLAVVGIGAYLYFTDYAAQAKVTARASQTDCGVNHQCWVEVTPNLYAYHVRKTLDASSWGFVCVGYHVSYHVNTGHYQVFDRDGTTLLYDSQQGLIAPGQAGRCAI